MNIFEVLNQGNSKLHEPSISAMLGYLLDTSRDHGLGDIFFREFLKIINKDIGDNRLNKYLNSSFIDTDILLEEPYDLNGSSKNIDIQVSILKKDDDGNKYEDFRILIENKTRISSFTQGQLKDYYMAVTEDEDINSLAMIFLTPATRRQTIIKEYENLKLNNPNHLKTWLNWNNGKESIINILKNVLIKESEGDINPINEYTRHTIKAFILFLNNTIKSKKSKGYRFGEDIGEIVDSIEVKLKGKDQKYKIIRRDSQQIQVFKDNEKVTAKPILRKIIKERNLDIPLSGINTRTMGRKVLKEIRRYKNN